MLIFSLGRIASESGPRSHMSEWEGVHSFTFFLRSCGGIISSAPLEHTLKLVEIQAAP